jgi:membrane fusion protein, multidrug efflux system
MHFKVAREGRPPGRESVGSVEIRPVVLGPVIGVDEVIEKGNQPGERVVTDGPLILYPGDKAAIRNSSPPASGSQP